MSLKARIPKGTVIVGTFPEGIKEAGRTYIVDVIAIDEAAPGYHHCHQPGTECNRHCWPGQEAMVVWAGAGGYWHHAPLADVELLSDQPVAS